MKFASLQLTFFRKQAQIFRKLKTDLETKIENLEQNITNENKFNECKTAKDELENFYDNIITLLLESKLEVNTIGINTMKNLLNII